MKTIQDKYYPLRIWATTILISPILQMLFIVFYVGHGGLGVFLEGIGTLIFAGAVLSIPALFLLYIIYVFLNSMINLAWLIKCFLFLSVIVLLTLTLYFLFNFLGGSFEHIKSKFFLFAYSLCALISIISFGQSNRTRIK